MKLTDAIGEMEAVLNATGALETMINNLASSTSRRLGSQIKAKYIMDLREIITTLNSNMSFLIGPDQIAITVTGLELVVGLPRKERVVAMKAIFELLLSFLTIIEKHTRRAIENVVGSIVGFDILKSNILDSVTELEKELALIIRMN